VGLSAARHFFPVLAGVKCHLHVCISKVAYAFQFILQCISCGTVLIIMDIISISSFAVFNLLSRTKLRVLFKNIFRIIRFNIYIFTLSLE